MKKIVSLIVASAIAMFSFSPMLISPVEAALVEEKDIFVRTCTDFGITEERCPEYESEAKFQQTVGTIIRYALIFIGLLAVAFIVWGALRITMSGGNAETVKEGRRTIIFALIGLAAATLASVLVGIIFSAVDDAFLSSW
jgi:hypothetical protein